MKIANIDDRAVLEIVGDTVDWEVELVVVIGRRADRVDEADAWSHVAGVTVGQDISDRILQFSAGAQFSPGKSRRGFGPMGPSAVLPLLPGDVIFTGTPSGIGATRTPARFLQPGQELTTWIEGIGTIRNRCR